MKQRRRIPTDQEMHEAVMRRIDQMTPEDWRRSIEELSRAPEGVEDPWPPYDNGDRPLNESDSSPADETIRPKKGG